MSVDELAWTLMGVLTAAVLGNFWYLGSKIDSINARIDALAARLDDRMDALAGRLDAHIERHAS